MKITVLGSGASSGIPLIGCNCAVCTSDDQKNKRSRVSVLVEKGATKALIDTSPDLRQQCLDNNILTVDAVLYTHAHADHCHGIDDMRSLNYHRQGPIPAYSDRNTLAEIQDRFSYAFREAIPEYGWFRPCLEAVAIDSKNWKPFQVSEELEVTAFPQDHGSTRTLGFRIGDFAYSTDVKRLDEQAFSVLEGVKVWIVDCLRIQPAPTHAHLDLTLEWIERVKPEKAYLTHMSHDFDYETLKAELPDHIEPAYDGMVIDL